MSFTFRPAARENVSLLIGLAGGPGSGKTYTGMRLASGMSGEKRFAVIDTEAGRAKHYADQFAFDHGDLTPPFTPARYLEAIEAADKADYPVIMVDSFSHEWSGEGGCLDMQEAEFKRLGGRDGVKMLSWVAPKGEHKRMVQKLLQVRAHLILCFRAEPKIEIVKKDGRTEVQAKQSLIGKDGWIPIVEKNLPFETTCYFLLLASAPGVPEPIKLQQQHRALFPEGKPITEDSGRLVAAWAAGGTSKPAPQQSPEPARARGDESPPPPSTAAAAGPLITPDQCANIETLCQDAKIPLERMRAAAQVDRLESMLAVDYADALAWIERQKQKKRA